MAKNDKLAGVQLDLFDSFPLIESKKTTLGAPELEGGYLSRERYDHQVLSQYSGASSRYTPNAVDNPPLGAWLIGDILGPYGREIEQVVLLDVENIEVGEDTGPEKYEDVRRYAQWLEEDKKAPPIRVLQTDSGRLKTLDHRRLLAAKVAGHGSILARVSWLVRDGKGLTFEMAKDGVEVMPCVSARENYKIFHDDALFLEKARSEKRGIEDGPGVVIKMRDVQSTMNDAEFVAQDVGQELVYNRRNRVKTGKRWEDVSGLNEALKAKESVKGNIWVKPDYDAMISDGMLPLVAHMVKQVYDSVSLKPLVGKAQGIGDENFERYFRAVSRVEEGVLSWANDKGAIKSWIEKNASYAGAMLGRRIALNDIAPASSLVDRIYPDGWRNHEDELRIAGGNKLLQALRPGYDEITRALKAINNGWPGKREAWQVQGYKIFEKPEIEVKKNRDGREIFYLSFGTHGYKRRESREEIEQDLQELKPHVLVGKRVGVIGSYDTFEEAIEAAREKVKKDKGGQTVSAMGMRVELAERIGKAFRREDENITSERLMEEFGFKGINFGNWMKVSSARAEAQLHLNHAFDAFHDLADVLGIPPNAISLNGMLGIAIGAQGNGQYSAHFVPGVNEINITRTKGAGAVAHEWAHALDHHYATLAGLGSVERPYLSAHAKLGETRTFSEWVDGQYVRKEVPRFGDLRPEILHSMKNVVHGMTKRLETADEMQNKWQVALQRAEKNLNGWLGSVRRDYGGLEEEYDRLAEKIRVGDFHDSPILVSKGTYLQPVVVEMRELYKQKHGRIYPLEKMKTIQAWMDLVVNSRKMMLSGEVSAPAEVRTDYLKNSVGLDQDKGGKVYWSTEEEMFARAFDAFVSDELEKKGRVNTYLSRLNYGDETVPHGAEREVLNQAFGAMVGQFKVRQTEQGEALFSIEEKKAGKHVSLESIHDEIDRLKKRWPSMPPVTVVNSPADLPFPAKENADGAHYRGRAYVVAGNIDDMRQLQKVLAHECVLHYGLEDMLGPYGFSKLHHGLQKLKREGDPTITEIAADIGRRYGELAPEQETKEIVARAGELCLDEQGSVKPEFGFMKGVFAKIASFLRDLGFKIPFTNVELQGIIHNAGKWVERDNGRLVANEGGRGVVGKGVLHSFAGVHAENAPIEALREAREMQAVGVDDREIWAKTGWTFGFKDGKPRFEVSDQGASVVVEGRGAYQIFKDMSEIDPKIRNIQEFEVMYPDHSLVQELKNGVSAAYERMAGQDLQEARSIADYLAHDKLYGAYPDLKEIRAFRPSGVDGMVNSGDASYSPDQKVMKFSGIKVPSRFESSSVHELQHAVQEIEGFAPGGTPANFSVKDVTKENINALQGKIQALYDGNGEFYRSCVCANQLMGEVRQKYGKVSVADKGDPLVQKWWSAIEERDRFPESKALYAFEANKRQLERHGVKMSPMEQYYSLAGEVEARLVQQRKDLSVAERRAVYPVDQMDVPVEKQTIPPEWWNGQMKSVLAREGEFAGMVVDVFDGLVFQRIGRAGEIAHHVETKLSSPVVIGEVVNIKYRGGQGVVTRREKEPGVGR